MAIDVKEKLNKVIQYTDKFMKAMAKVSAEVRQPSKQVPLYKQGSTLPTKAPK